MKKLIFVLMLGLILGIATSASAVSVSATATGDNWVWVWQNNAWTEGTNYWKWQVADTTSITGLSYGQSADFYFAVMNEDRASGNPAGLLAQLSGVTFKETGTDKLLSNTVYYWQVAAVTNATWGLGQDGVRPPEGQSSNPTDPGFNPTSISNWTAPTSYGTNDDGVNLWGPVPGIDGKAEWLWTANNNYTAPSTMDQLAVFKVTATPVPEPASVALLCMGLVGLAGRKLRRKFTA